MMKNLREFATVAAREAGALLKNRFGLSHSITFKGDIDIVTEADRLSENLLVAGIRETYPDHGILSEESPAIEGGSDVRWIIDPLDGTTNYAHGFPFFCVSIALERKGETVLGVIYDPLLDELFLAEKNGGAFLNGSPIAVSDTRDLSNSLLATGFPYDIRVNPDNNLGTFNRMALRARAIRRAGSAALDLAYLAAGRFDGYWELRLKPWDRAAGALMVTEAGGVVSDLAGEEHTLVSEAIVASNGLIHAGMLDVLAENPDGSRDPSNNPFRTA